MIKKWKNFIKLKAQVKEKVKLGIFIYNPNIYKRKRQIDL